MTPAQIQTLIDACRTSPADLVTWLELKAVLEGLKNQDIGLVLTTTGTTGAATFDNDSDTLNIPNYSIDVSGFVPYTGATGNVTLGEYGILAGWYRLDLTPTGTPTDQGTMYWDDNQKTLALIMNGTIQKVGHDQFYHAKNSTGTTIPKGTAVRFAGTDGSSGHLLITPFLADGSNPSSYFMGVTAEAITNGSFGKVQSFGRLDGVDTSAFNEGDILYASTTVAGGFQTTVPVAPNNIVQVAAVVAATNNGKLLIRPTLGSKLTSDESVKLTSVANGNVLQYNSTLSVWENVAPSSLSVNNIYTADGTLTGNRTVTSGGFTLTFTGSNTASSGAARGINLTHTLIADANNDVLSGLNLSPSFTNGAFTGVSNYSLIVSRSNASSAITSMVIGNVESGNILNAEVSRLEFKNGTAVSGGVPFGRISYLSLSTNASFPENGALDFYGHPTIRGMRVAWNALTFDLASTFATTINQTAGYFIQGTGGTSTGIATALGSADHRFRFLDYWAETVGNSSQFARWYNTSTTSYAMILFGSNNLGINTTTDAGFRLDVNGTMRVQGSITQTGSSNTLTLGNGLIFGTDGGTTRIFNGSTIRYQSNTTTAVQHRFQNEVGFNNEAIISIESGGSVATKTSGTLESLRIIGRRALSSGTAVYAGISLKGNVENTGTFTGTHVGFIYDPTIIGSGFTHRAIQTVTGDLLFGTTSGSVGIGANTSIAASAILDITSTTKGVLFPRMTGTQRANITSPAEGLIVYDTTAQKLYLNTSAGWEEITSALP